ncbi:unnamed protein product [Colias eurytheme]|nr:unnamed protein product [Colias eurytheme]
MIETHFSIDALGISMRVKPSELDERAVQAFESSVTLVDTAQINRLVSERYDAKCEGDARLWYLPHFPVTNPNKPGKTRQNRTRRLSPKINIIQ